MRSPWLQLLLLFIYLLFVLVATRLLDLILWYQRGSAPTAVVNPLLLKVQQIKLLLDSRGVSYTEYLEKSELVQLLQDSADLMVGEVEQVSETTLPLKERLKPGPTISYFSGGAHFYEQVEDTRDSVWLVQVLTSSEPLLDEYSWRLVCSQLEPFGVRIGIFDCQQDMKLCETKGWSKPLLLLAMPKGRKSKDKVVLQPFTSSKPQVIVDWVCQQLSLWVKQVQKIEEVEEQWLTMNGSRTSNSSSIDDATTSSLDKTSVRVLLLSHLLQPPLFLAALSIKFTGRIHFGMFTVKKEDAEAVRKRLRLNERKLPVYLVITPEKKIYYGSKKLEYFNMLSMNIFLRGIQPETNDVFLCSLLFANMLVGLTICLTSTRLWWKWAAYCLWTLVKYNLWLFTMWLIFLALARFAVFGIITDRLLLILRIVGLSDWGSFVRTQIAVLTFHPFPFIFSFAFFSLTASCIIRLLASSWLISSPNDLELDSRPWWEVLPMDSYWVNYLFRPMASLSRPMPASQIELEDGIEMLMLIERLAVPNFWLQPVIPVDYIKDLPVWKYRGYSVVEKQPQPCCTKTRATHFVSPELLEQIMDADEPNNSILCHCQGSNSVSCPYAHSQDHLCSHSSVPFQCPHRPEFQRSISCSKGRPKVPEQDLNSQQSVCFCSLETSCSGTSEANQGSQSMPGQSIVSADKIRDIKLLRSKQNMCVSCPHADQTLPPDNHKHCHLFDTDPEESDISDSDHISWAVPSTMILTTDCAVCLETYNHGSLICGLPCGHNYHQQCILAWLHRDNHHCPVCRWPAYKTKSFKNHLHQE